MKKPSDIPACRTLHDAYKISGFRVRARIDGYDELKHPAFVLTLDRHKKKRCAAGVARHAAVFTAYAGDECAISIAATGRSISIFPCGALNARRAA
jgi:hypothetical protein